MTEEELALARVGWVRGGKSDVVQVPLPVHGVTLPIGVEVVC
jgi:hypothetical protein